MEVNQQTNSPLFKLPAELRNRIYEHASLTHPFNDEPSIFRTCRKVRAEGLKLFYVTHVFAFLAKARFTQRWNSTRYQHFLTSIGDKKANLIEHLCFQVGNESEHASSKDGLRRPRTRAVSICVAMDAEKAEVASAVFSREDVLGEDVTTLENARVPLNGAWAAHPNPSKEGMLRTLPALVPLEVKFVESQDADAV